MIAALAAGLLGQIEGSRAIANGLSSLLGAKQPPAISQPASPPSGRARAAHQLSDSVQATLLQLQSAGAVQTDDVGQAVGNIG